MDGHGSVAWWGYSPPLELCGGEVPECKGEERMSSGGSSGQCPCGRDQHILLVGASDLRHVLRTMASSSSSSSSFTSIHFVLLESCLEVYARHMLFLKLLGEPPEQLGLQEKVELFLEIFGNTLIRPQTAEYIKSSSSQLIKNVTDLDSCASSLPILDLSELKFKERDFLEGIFKFWASPHSFPVEQCWDGRLRSYLGSRYDSRHGVFDWDYHMKLVDMTKLVDVREYKSWREDGVAFKLRRDAPYEVPNRTLASGLLYKQGGDLQARRGYWGDIVSSPYLSFGIKTDKEQLLKTEGGKQVKTSTDVSEDVLAELISTLTSSEAPSLVDGSCLLTFLPLNSVQQISKKARYQNLFSAVYFSNSMVHNLVGEAGKVFSEGCFLAIETARFMLDLNKDKKEEYVTKVSKMAESCQFKKLASYKDNEDQLLYVK